MGAFGVAILARAQGMQRPFDFSVTGDHFKTREINCHRCANQCEIICVYRGDQLIDAWGNRCERGEIKVGS